MSFSLERTSFVISKTTCRTLQTDFINKSLLPFTEFIAYFPGKDSLPYQAFMVLMLFN